MTGAVAEGCVRSLRFCGVSLSPPQTAAPSITAAALASSHRLRLSRLHFRTFEQLGAVLSFISFVYQRGDVLTAVPGPAADLGLRHAGSDRRDAGRVQLFSLRIELVLNAREGAGGFVEGDGLVGLGEAARSGHVRDCRTGVIAKQGSGLCSRSDAGLKV